MNAKWATVLLMLLPQQPSAAGRDVHWAKACAAIDSTLAHAAAPGLIVGITDRERLLEVFFHGYADAKARVPLSADSRFAIGSVSKSFTAVALLQLLAEGRFDVHAPIGRYLPDLTVNQRLAAITAHHLLSHTAGLPNYLADAASSRYVTTALRDFEPSYAPGAHWWYSNTGYQLLGYVLEGIEGIPYEAIIRRRILDRLGMSATAADIDDAQRTRLAVSYRRWPYDGAYVEMPWFEYSASDGSITSNVTDMSTYLRFILNRGVGSSGRLLSEQDFTLLTTAVMDGYAYGLFVSQENGETVISHRGDIAGYSAEIEAHMEEGIGLVFLGNGGAIDPKLKKWITRCVISARHGKDPAPAELSGDPYAVEPQQYVGVYLSGSGDVGETLEFTSSGGRLRIKRSSRLVTLERMGSDLFRESGADSDRLPYFFRRVPAIRGNSEVAGVSHGAEWFSKQRTDAIPPPLPQEYSAFVGHFEYSGPEGPSARVFVRSGHLILLTDVSDAESVQELEPLSPGVFRVGEPAYNPERARFDTVVGGRAMRLLLSGVPLYRRDTP
jgi:D-alanyl-D-alanine carboxypeptidase